jgi:glucosamine--fructose-6-phosphate aminotransferase (isomerizing)
VQLVHDDEIVTIHPNRAYFRSAAGNEVEREIEEITWDDDAAEKAGYPTFMLKEIHEQSDAWRRRSPTASRTATGSSSATSGSTTTRSRRSGAS